MLLKVALSRRKLVLLHECLLCAKHLLSKAQQVCIRLTDLVVTAAAQLLCKPAQRVMRVVQLSKV